MVALSSDGACMAARLDLLKAIENSNLKALEKIPAGRPRLDRPLGDGVLPLMSAAVQGDPRIIGALLAAGAKATQRCKYFQQTALHYARKPEGAKLLVDAGGDVNAPDDHGSTPLHSAVNDRNPAMARFLLERGAKPNVHNSQPQRETPLHIASGHGDAKVVELLFAHGADPNRRSEHGITPLMDAAYCRKASALKVIEMLLRAPSDGWHVSFDIGGRWLTENVGCAWRGTGHLGAAKAKVLGVSTGSSSLIREQRCGTRISLWYKNMSARDFAKRQVRQLIPF
jgi:ankyrin repeat protein